MDNFISRHPNPPAISPRISGVCVTRMVCVEVISLRSQIPIHLDAHPNRVAISRLWHIIINQIIRLKHLQGKWHSATAKRFADHPDEDLTRLGHAARQQPLHVVEAKQAAHIAAAFVHPPLPLLMHLAIDHLIKAPAAQHLDLTLVPDPMTDHIVLDRANRLPCVIVITHQLPRTVAQCFETGLDLAVGTRAARHPVRSQPAHPCALVCPTLGPQWLKTHRPK